MVSGVLLVGAGCVPVEPPSTKFADQVKAAQPGGPAAGVLPWFCRSQGRGLDHVPELGQHQSAYEGKEKGELSMADCAGVAAFLDKAWTTARRYPTRRVALTAGALQAVQFMPGVGTHDVIPGVTGYQYDAPDPVAALLPAVRRQQSRLAAGRHELVCRPLRPDAAAGPPR